MRTKPELPMLGELHHEVVYRGNEMPLDRAVEVVVRDPAHVFVEMRSRVVERVLVALENPVRVLKTVTVFLVGVARDEREHFFDLGIDRIKPIVHGDANRLFHAFLCFA